MVIPAVSLVDSPFLNLYIPLFLERFSLSYQKESTCIEYFLFSREKNARISRSLIISHEVFSNSIYVSKFYPEIYREIRCRYLSAACFYLMAHHAVKNFHLADNCCVHLESETRVFNDFYARLNDFNFKICIVRPADRVYITGRYHQLPFDTDMITLDPSGADF
jgi:hypothetical protein